PALSDAGEALEQSLVQVSRDLAVVGEAELNVFLVQPVEVAAAGLDQAVAVGEFSVLFDVDCAVIAVDDFQALEAEVFQVLDDAFEFAIVEGAELNRMGEDRDAA